MKQKDIEKYKEKLKNSMIEQGATQNELNLVTEEVIINAIEQSRNPEDVAWALLQ